MTDAQHGTATAYEEAQAGLCTRCSHARRIPHPRGGAAYWRCGMHDEDQRMPKYPRLPVERCTCFHPCAPAQEPRG